MPRRAILLPSPVHGSIRLLVHVDRRVNRALQDSVDYLVTACIIIAVFSVLALAAIVLLVEVGADLGGIANDACLALYSDSSRKYPCDSID